MRRGWLARPGDEFALGESRTVRTSAAHRARARRRRPAEARRRTSSPRCAVRANAVPARAGGMSLDARRCDDRAVKILSIQSAVAYGHVGNSAAVFPLQRIGVEVLPVYTVNFSNHTGYGAWRGPMISPDDVREVITGIEERGAFPRDRCRALGLPGRRGHRRRHPRRGRAGQGRQPRRHLRVRPRHGQREVRMLRGARDSRSCCATASCPWPTSSRRTSSSSASSPTRSPTRSSRRSPRWTSRARSVRAPCS